MKYFWLVLGLLAALSSQAAVVTVSWTNPTQYTDGTTLPPAAISQSRVEYGDCTGGQINQKFGEFLATGAATSAPSPDLAPSQYAYCFRVFTTAGGLESGPSAVVSKTITTGPACTHPASPATTQTALCPAPQTGSWTQTRTCTESVCPVGGGTTTWTCGAWTPTTAPAGTCTTTTAVWKVAPNGTATTRPAYEKIRDPSNTQWIVGYKYGDIPIGKLCGPVKEVVSTTEYHSVLESDTALQSVTYSGRNLVARCVKQ